MGDGDAKRRDEDVYSCTMFYWAKVAFEHKCKRGIYDERERKRMSAARQQKKKFKYVGGKICYHVIYDYRKNTILLLYEHTYIYIYIGLLISLFLQWTKLHDMTLDFW